MQQFMDLSQNRNKKWETIDMMQRVINISRGIHHVRLGDKLHGLI